LTAGHSISTVDLLQTSPSVLVHGRDAGAATEAAQAVRDVKVFHPERVVVRGQVAVEFVERDDAVRRSAAGSVRESG